MSVCLIPICKAQFSHIHTQTDSLASVNTITCSLPFQWRLRTRRLILISMNRYKNVSELLPIILSNETTYKWTGRLAPTNTHFFLVDSIECLSSLLSLQTFLFPSLEGGRPRPWRNGNCFEYCGEQICITKKCV